MSAGRPWHGSNNRERDGNPAARYVPQWRRLKAAPKEIYGKSQTQTFSCPPGKAAGSSLPDAGHSGRVPAVSRTEASPLCLSEVRILRRKTRDGSERSEITFLRFLLSARVSQLRPARADREWPQFLTCGKRLLRIGFRRFIHGIALRASEKG